jgi:manganese oxidase
MSPRVRTATIAVAASLTLIATACVRGSGDAATTPDQAAAAAVRIDVMLSDFAIEPSPIPVPVGAALRFVVMNHGAVPHTFALEVEGTSFDTGEIAPGASGEVETPALDAGTYDAICSVPGHEDLGMVASVTASVEVDPASGPAGTTGAGPAPHATMTAREMAEMHEQGVKDFLAGDQTSTRGNRPLRPILDDGVKVFVLTAWPVRWEVSKDNLVDAMAYNEQIPGPEIRVGYGDRVRFVVHNQLDEPTALHFHGMTLPNAQDGVPSITQDPAMPGETWVYEFTVKDPPGMYVYHSHFNSTAQVGNGLYGAIIVDPPAGRWAYPRLDVDPRTGATTQGAPVDVAGEHTLFLGDGPLGYVLNGKSFPATEPIVAERGDWVLIHMANDGAMLHPMHLHGYHFAVVGQDGFPLEQPYMADTLVIAPGQRFDVLVHAIYPGAWAFHCHILPHVEGPEGMFGMVTALVVR